MTDLVQTAASPTSTAPAASPRLLSLDALRGFDMFWIVGGAPVVLGLVALTGRQDLLDWCTNQERHAAWAGFHFEDLIFPLFLFVAGAAVPFSLLQRQQAGDSVARLHWRVLRRALLLVLLGMICNGLLRLRLDAPSYPRLASVLGRIGLAYAGGAIIALHCRPRWQGVWLAGLLLGYYLALTLIPVPGFGAGNLEPGKNLANYIDLHFLPGKCYRDWGDPEGLLAIFPAIGTALLGILAGHCLRRADWPATRKVLTLLAAGGAGLALGYLWDCVFPINKALWSSSFVLVAGGWSFLLLAAFYLVIDVWGFRRWAFFFVVIGMNSITIYLACAIVDFPHIADYFFGGAIRCFAPTLKSWNKELPALLAAAGTLLVEWLFLYFLYCKKTFLRL